MRLRKLSMFGVLLALLAASALVLSQPRAPQAPAETIKGVKMSAPLTVLRTAFRAPTADPEAAIGEAAELVWRAAAAAGINILPNHGIVTVLTPMAELMQAPEEADFDLRAPLIDDLEPGELAGHPGVEVLRVEPEVVAYTYSRGPGETAIEVGITSVINWAIGEGYELVGPIYILLYQDVENTDPTDLVWELQVGVKVPEGEAGG